MPNLVDVQIQEKFGDVILVRLNYEDIVTIEDYINDNMTQKITSSKGERKLPDLVAGEVQNITWVIALGSMGREPQPCEVNRLHILLHRLSMPLLS